MGKPEDIARERQEIADSIAALPEGSAGRRHLESRCDELARELLRGGPADDSPTEEPVPPARHSVIMIASIGVVAILGAVIGVVVLGTPNIADSDGSPEGTSGQGEAAADDATEGDGAQAADRPQEGEVGDPPTRLTQVQAGCTDMLMGDGMRFHGSLGDDGLTITLDGVGQDASVEQQEPIMASLECILDRTEATQAVRARLGATRALDGMQDADYGPFAATWTYHPDAGVDLIVEERSDAPESD